MKSERLIKWAIEELAISYISKVFEIGQIIIILCSAVRTHNCSDNVCMNAICGLFCSLNESDPLLTPKKKRRKL